MPDPSLLQAQSVRTPGRQPRPRRKRSRGGTALVLNMAPMIDMTFLLFSFVLVTSNFERPEGVLASQLPASAATSVALPFSPIIVRISQTGPSAGDVEIMVDRFTDGPRPLGELAGLLAEIQRQPGFDRQTPVVLVAGDEVHWDYVVGAWNAALRAGCTNIAFSEQR